ncbi:MAG: sugar ABC transporter substrate-binding protein [Butyrivibrio sp.]|jgi:putative multiple sugar transport system substrate-binding protein|nr:sugar ABC transporter substrate-binding protein [Butyrivibrio sp.]
MKKKLLGAFLSVAMTASMLVGCGGGSSAPATTDSNETTEAPAAEETKEETTEAAAEETAETTEAAETTAGGGIVGVAMPTKDLQRWNQDGANMQQQLEAAGYTVDLQYASNDIATQVSQIENMISSGAQVLVIASIDGDSLGTVLAQAKEAGISVIAYDRLIMNSDAVSYYATFDNYMVGTKQGEYIEQQLDLKNADGPFNIEIFTGDPGDNNARFFYGGAMDVLRPYIDEGKLVVKSGQVEFDEVATANWATETAQSRMDAIISANYADGTKLDAVLCSNDSTALGATNSLEANYTGDWPIITGQDCDVANVKNMIAGKQSMSIFKDTRDLAAKTVEMVDAIMKGTEAPVNDTETYDNGTGVIPSYLCEPVFADINNYKELLIDSGYYSESDLQ